MQSHISDENEIPGTSAEQKHLDNQSWNIIDKKYYLIRYPNTWRLDTKPNGVIEFTLFLKYLEGERTVQENINFITQDMANVKEVKVDLDKYVELSEWDIKTRMGAEYLLESRRILKGGVEFHKIRYRHILEDVLCEYIQYYFFKNDTIQILTYGAEFEHFESAKKEALEIMASFKPKNY
jgi:hypothetical protein